MGFSVAVRAYGYSILDSVLPAVGKPLFVMNFKIRFSISSSLEWRRLFAKLTNSLSTNQNLCDYIRVTVKHLSPNLDLTWALWC